MSVTILEGDCLAVLRTMPDESVHCVVTSPPYYALRDYGVAGQIGLEASPREFIEKLVAVFREVRRVLRSDGTAWVNMGDSYAGSWGAQGRPNGESEQMANRSVTWARQINAHPQLKSRTGSIGSDWGMKPKDKMLMPHRLAIALCDDGWWIRDDIVWAKPNPMPESVRDRCTKAHEYIFLLAKSARYHYDAEAITEPASYNTHERRAKGTGVGFGHGTDKQDRKRERIKAPAGWDQGKGAHGTIHKDGRRKLADIGSGTKNNSSFDEAMAVMPELRNKRSVWTVPSQPFKEAHFACVDSETEALTMSGWKRHNELLDGDLIAAYDRNTKDILWQAATFHRYDFDGELVAIEKRDTSQRLTPNHRCLVKRRSSGEGVVIAEDLKPGMQVPMAAKLRTIERVGPGIAFAALLGWYVTEGEKKRGNIIRINQSESANPQHVRAIRGLLDSLNAVYSERSRTREWRGRPSIEVTFNVRGKIADALAMASPKKQIDLTWRDWPAVDIQAFLDAVIDGDGHRRKDGRACVIQKDREFLDRLQVMAIRLGLRAHVSERHEGTHALYLTTGDWLTLRASNGKHAPLVRERYRGVVWCPNVPSTFWLARRSGKPFITGNTFPPALIEPCILAGCPVGGTVLDPFGGAGTTGLVADRLQRDAILIELNPTYAAMARRRITNDSPLFAEVA